MALVAFAHRLTCQTGVLLGNATMGDNKLASHQIKLTCDQPAAESVPGLRRCCLRLIDGITRVDRAAIAGEEMDEEPDSHGPETAGFSIQLRTRVEVHSMEVQVPT